jgi:hypothetical protein
MGTQSFRFGFILLFCSIIIADEHLNVVRQKIILTSLFTHSSYPSIHFALKQIESLPMDIELELNSTDEVIPVGYFKLIVSKIFSFLVSSLV